MCADHGLESGLQFNLCGVLVQPHSKACEMSGIGPRHVHTQNYDIDLATNQCHHMYLACHQTLGVTVLTVFFIDNLGGEYHQEV